MNASSRTAYQRAVQRAAGQIGLPPSKDLEGDVIRHCVHTVSDWIRTHGAPSRLAELPMLFAASVELAIEEVHDQSGLNALLRKYPPAREPGMARLAAEFSDDVDGITLYRGVREPWERPYLAVVNCQGWHSSRQHFSKWHEIAHRLIEGAQLTFAFRKTHVNHPEPEELLVDKIAAQLAFLPELLCPVLEDELQGTGGFVTLELVERVRARLIPEASWEATVRACLYHSPRPTWFLKCGVGYKKAEERQMASGQIGLGLLGSPTAKLRVIQSTSSDNAPARVRFHERMQVPESSVIRRAFDDPFQRVILAEERLDDWKTSSDGVIGQGQIIVDASKRGPEVVALVTLGSFHEIAALK